MKRPLLNRLGPVRTTTALSAAGLLSLLPLIASCGQGDASPRAPRTAQQLYDRTSCFTCHGARGEGSGFAPPLRNLSTWWERESLAEFLLMGRSGEAPNEHIVELREQFKGRVMPPLTESQASHEERLILADWLLAF